MHDTKLKPAFIWRRFRKALVLHADQDALALKLDGQNHDTDGFSLLKYESNSTQNGNVRSATKIEITKAGLCCGSI